MKMRYFTWDRKCAGAYECSSKGDRRFSAFYAILPNGNSIEFEYQVKIKGHPSIESGKGKPPVRPVRSLFAAYKALWETFFNANPLLLAEIQELGRAHGNCFTDMFASSAVNQARAIATILNDRIAGECKYAYHVDGTKPEHSVLVFGSNMSGIHGKGAALLAREEYGAELGTGEGLVDLSYALPTVDYLIQGAARQPPLSLIEIGENVEIFKQVAIGFQTGPGKLRFFVTRVGCVLAGYSDKEIAPLFRNSPTNCSFAESWKAYLEI